MPFTLDELENVANATIDFHANRPEVRAQSIQDKPLLKIMRSKEQSFPGGKDEITVGVKGTRTNVLQGFEHDDQVSYYNPANIKRARYPYKLLHSGLKFTLHELAKDGISIKDTSTGKGEAQHSQREKTALANILSEKVDDWMEDTDTDFNLMFWRDGTQDADKVPGILSFILDDPTTATVIGGIDQSANVWWRNRANVAIDASTASNSNIVKTLQSEWRQLRRYRGRPDTVLCGSDFLQALENELRALGTLTDSGWKSTKQTDASIADVYFKGVKFEYDPTLDDEGKAKYCYILDSRRIHPMAIEGESMKKHNPARPADRYVVYRALTWMGGLTCSQRNANGVYAIL